MNDEHPFNTLPSIAKWAASLGYKGIQVPINPRLIDIDRAAESQDYCNDILSMLRATGIELTELSSHLHGQLIAVHPAYDIPFDGFAPESLRGNPKAREEWAPSILFKAAKASKNLGLVTHATFSGALAWPYLYPWPQRAEGLVDTAFEEVKFSPIPKPSCLLNNSEPWLTDFNYAASAPMETYTRCFRRGRRRCMF